MSDTPRTDEQINGKPCTRFAIMAGDSLRDATVQSEFARTLERELNEARDRQWADAIHSCHNECARPMCVLRRERDEARNDVRDLMEQYQDQLQYGDEFVDCELINSICDRLNQWETKPNA
jgi:hypothetical protein